MKSTEELKVIISQGEIKKIESILPEIKKLSREDQEDIIAGSVILKYNNIFKLLLENDLPINSKDKGSKTPILIHAIRNHDLDLAKYIISKGVNIHDTDSYGNSALMEAIVERFDIEEIIPLLLELGADLDQNNSSGKTPRALAKSFRFEIPKQKNK